MFDFIIMPLMLYFDIIGVVYGWALWSQYYGCTHMDMKYCYHIACCRELCLVSMHPLYYTYSSLYLVCSRMINSRDTEHTKGRILDVFDLINVLLYFFLFVTWHYVSRSVQNGISSFFSTVSRTHRHIKTIICLWSHLLAPHINALILNWVFILSWFIMRSWYEVEKI